MADVFVRYLLGSEKNKDLLIDFINAVFRRKGRRAVTDLEIRNPFNLREAFEAKESILDVKAREAEGRWINVEVQVAHEESFAARSLYYWAKSYQNQLADGDVYGRLEPSVCINLLGFVIFPELTDLHNCFRVTEKDNPEYVLTEHLQIHFLEVPKLKPGPGSDISDKAEAWCYFFKNEGRIEEADMPVLLKDDQFMRKARDEYRAFTADDRMMDMAEAREKWRHDVASQLDTAMRRGREEGEKLGLEQGIEQGIEQGLERAKRKLPNACLPKGPMLRSLRVSPGSRKRRSGRSGRRVLPGGALGRTSAEGVPELRRSCPRDRAIALKSGEQHPLSVV